jgi:acyl carrier protein
VTECRASAIIVGSAYDACGLQAAGERLFQFLKKSDTTMMVSANSSTTLKRVQELLQAHFSLAPDQVRPDTPLVDLGIDSLAAIEFMFELENQFQVSLSDERTELVTVADIVAVVEHAFSSAAKPA